MAIIISENNSGNFEPVSADTHNAVCVGVWDLGWHNEEYLGVTKRQHKVVVTWEVDEKIGDKNKTISKFYTLSLNTKAKLRIDLVSWRGTDFTPEELKAFDLESIIGKPCLLGVIEVNDRARISSISKLPKGMATIDITGDYTAVPAWIEKFRERAIVLDVPNEPAKLDKNGKRDASIADIFG